MAFKGSGVAAGHLLPKQRVMEGGPLVPNREAARALAWGARGRSSGTVEQRTLNPLVRR